jgi:intein/homing endonuclease
VVVDSFTRVSPTLLVKVRGITIEATPEHPLWVLGFGWKPAAEVAAGDELLTSDNRKVVCEGVTPSGRVVTVYNMEVAGDHTYFVGDDVWGFDVWVHNAGRRYQSLLWT